MQLPQLSQPQPAEQPGEEVALGAAGQAAAAPAEPELKVTLSQAAASATASAPAEPVAAAPAPEAPATLPAEGEQEPAAGSGDGGSRAGEVRLGAQQALDWLEAATQPAPVASYGSKGSGAPAGPATQADLQASLAAAVQEEMVGGRC